jgi:hypothetical protein
VPASAHVVDWQQGSARRIVLLPPLARLVACFLGAAVVAGALAFVWTRRLRRPIGDLADVVAPVRWLLLWVVPYLPGLASALPVLVVLDGSARAIVAAAVASRVLWTFTGARLAAGARRLDPRLSVVFATALAVYLVAGTWVTSETGFGGDEPHYLIITHSLLADGDLRIENNHDARDYEAFFPGDLRMHYLRRGVGGVIYSVHAPGLPALLLPFYAVAGAAGAVVAIGLFGALASVAMYRLARDLAGRGVALVTWVSVCLTTPFLMHGWLVFPEMPAACLAAWGLWWVWAHVPARVWIWACRGAALSLLPWLHTKFVIILAGLGVALALKVLRKPAALLALALPVAISLGLWLYAFFVMYGVADPTVPYGGARGAGLDWANVPRGVLGLLFDQEYGLLPYSPVYALAVPGLIVAARRRDTRGLLAAAAFTAAAFVAATTRYYMWWGGWSVPARFLVPVLPLAAPFVALGIERLARAASGRAIVAAAALVSVGVAFTLIAVPGRYLLFNDRDGTGKLLELVQGTVPVASMLPSFLLIDWPAQLPRLGLMVGAAVGGLLLFGIGTRLMKRAPVPALTGALAVAACIFAALALLGRVGPSRQATSEMVRAGRSSLLQAWDPDALAPVDPDTTRRLDKAAVVRRASLVVPAPEADTRGDLTWWWGPFDLPPGRYDFRVWLRGPRGPAGEVWAVFHRSSARAGHAASGTGSPVTMTVEVPRAIVGQPLWLGASSADVAASMASLEITPIEIVARRDRAREPALAVESIAGRDRAYLVYVDRNAYPEGGVFWTRGEWVTTVKVVPAGASTVSLVLQAGAWRGAVRVTADDTTHTVPMEPWSHARVDLPIGPRVASLSIEIAAPAGFRPSEVDPSSRDHRWLGCRVRVELGD